MIIENYHQFEPNLLLGPGYLCKVHLFLGDLR